MARINDRLVIQRVGDAIVIVDEVAGTELVFPAVQVPNVNAALRYLTADLDLPEWRAPYEGGERSG